MPFLLSITATEWILLSFLVLCLVRSVPQYVQRGATTPHTFVICMTLGMTMLCFIACTAG